MKEKLLTGILLLSAGLLAYCNCFDVFISADNYSQLYVFDKGFCVGLHESSLAAAPYFSGFSFMYVLYFLFKDAPVFWVGFGILFHVMNAFLVFQIISLLLRVASSYKYPIAVFSAMVFLFSPYQAESVLWVSGRWLFHAFVFLLGLYVLLLYIVRPDTRQLFFLHLFFVLALFSNETAFMFPLLGGVLFFFIRKQRKSKVSARKFLIEIIFFQLLLIAFYFVLNKLYLGNWFWHGGDFDQIANTTSCIKTGLKYLAKFFLFYRYLPYQLWDNYLRHLAEHQAILIALFLIAVMSLFFLLKKIIQSRNRLLHLLAVLFISFLVMLIPVLPLDSSFLSYYYPDRYAYIASAFFYPFLILVLFSISPKKYIYLSLAYVILCFVFLFQTTALWKASNSYCQKLVKDFAPFLSYDTVYVLNATAYYQGVPAFRSSLPEAIHYHFLNYPSQKIKILSGAYQDTYNDSIVSVLADAGNQEIKVRATPKPTPYFCTGGWAQSYSNREYEVNFDSTGNSYQVKFKNPISPRSVLLYISRGEWKKIELEDNILQRKQL